MFRALKADEIDVRIAQATEKGVSLLLYKDARVDQDILDETVGPMNWQRAHCRDNANCIISIWDKEKQQWISKEDTGTESNTEKEKGLASDSFKRAGFNWGIGRELYTAPFIWVDADKLKTLKKDGTRWVCKDTFHVQAVKIENKVITELRIYNDRTRNTCFIMGQKLEVQTPPAPQMHRCMRCGQEITQVNFKSGMTISVDEVIAKSVAAYGQEMCYNCCKAAAQAKNG